MSRKQRRRQLIKSIRLAWESLETHLDHSVTTKKIKHKEAREYCGDEAFNSQCVYDYSVIIYSLATELNALTDKVKEKGRK